MKRYIVKGQPINQIKLSLAKRMRREMTEEESILWEILRAKKLGVFFRRQQVISGFIADFYCASHGLIIECDGLHHTSDRDAERDSILESHQIRIIRIKNHSIRNNLPDVINEITQAISESSITK